MPRVRLICIEGALGKIFSTGVKVLAQQAHRIIGCKATTHAYGFGFGFHYSSPMINAAVEALDKGEEVILVGHSLGGDSCLRVAYYVKQKRRNSHINLIGAFDPTPRLWNVEDNVSEVWNPYQSRVLQLGGGRVRRQVGNTTTLVDNVMVDANHISMDEQPFWNAKVLTRIRQIVAQK